jgi:nucleotide-binding universal stress UspA family protein
MTSAKIIVGVDGSEHSIRALQWCATHAAELDAEVVAVHVGPDGWSAPARA